MEWNDLNCHDSVAQLAAYFDPQVAGNMKADIQFRISGDEPGTYYLEIAEGICSFREGESPAPRITILTPSETWQQIVRKQLSATEAVLGGRVKIEGDFSLLMRLAQLFRIL